MGRTWSLELVRDRITVNVVVLTAMTAMTATIPVYKEWAQAFEAGKTLPSAARRDHGLGGPEDVVPLIVWLASDDSADVTGQALGLGGDRLTLYSHPDELATMDAEGGWTTERIGQAWFEQLASRSQRSGPGPKADPQAHPAAPGRA